MLLPIGMSFTYRLAPPERRGTVMTVFGIPVLLAPALGPVLSGYLIEFADWRYVFLLNLPVGILAVILGLRALPALPADRAATPLDILGAILGPVAFAALIYGISQSATDAWTGMTALGGMVVGSVALVAFVARELTTHDPLLDLRVFRRPDFSLAIVTQGAVAAALLGTLFLVPLFLQQVTGYGALATGLYTVAQPIGGAVVMPLSGRIFDRFGARPTVAAGALLATGSFWFLAHLSTTTTGQDLIVPLFLWGAGLGLCLMPLSTQVLNTAPRHLVTRVTSLSNALQNVILSLAVACYATVLQVRLSGHLVNARAGTVLRTGSLMQDALVASFNDAFLVAASVAALALLLALTLRHVSAREEEEEPIAEHPIAAWPSVGTHCRYT
jgi:EmrB/QacA subfamily drug resistance transporter